MKDQTKTKTHFKKDLRYRRHELKIFEAKRRQTEMSLQFRVGFENLIATISTKFITLKPDHIDKAINQVLKKIGQFVGADRSYIFLFYDNKIKADNTHEWCARGIEPQIQNLKGLATKSFPWWMDKLNRFEALHIPRVVNLPPEARAEKELLQVQSIQSLIAVPMVVSGSLIGFLGFDSLRAEKKWTEDSIALLRLVGEFLANALNRKQKEEALRENGERYRVLFENSPTSITILNKSGVIIDCNKVTEELTGYSKEEIIGKPFEKLLTLTAKDLPKMKKNYEKLSNRLVVEPHEIEIIRKNGQRCWINVISSLLLKGNKVIGFQKIATDITQRKCTEETLRERNEKYHALTENINVGIYRNTAGPKGKFVEVNPAFVEMFGYKSKDQLFAMNVADLYQDSKDRKKFNKKMSKFGFVKNEELKLKKKDGTPLMGSVSAVAVKDEEGNVKYYDGVIEDVTEQKYVEDERQRSFNKLQRILEETVDALASTLGKRDPYTGGHQQRVTNLACAIAEDMGLSRDIIKGIRVAGLLHDIGKIAIPAEILSKPSRLTTAEFNIVKDHPQIGYEILKSVEFPWPIAEIVLQHHELLDGSGYPRGLRDSRILLEAKIMVVADVVEAMCSHRPYRPAHSLKTSLSEIVKYRGILYDPEVVDTCLKLFHKNKFQFLPNH